MGSVKLKVSALLLALTSLSVPGPAVADDGVFPAAPMKWSRTGPSALLLDDGRVLVTGGSGRGPSGVHQNSILEAEIYDPEQDAWTVAGSFNLAGTPVKRADGRVLMIGTTHAQYFDPASGAFSPPTALPRSFPTGTRTVLADGTVMATGGCCSSEGSAYASATLFDPVAWTVTSLPSMRVRRNRHVAEVLRDGRVLVVGGLAEEDIVPTRGAEIFDPVTRTWKLTTPSIYGEKYSMRMAGHQASLLPDGSVLVTGGCCVSYPQPGPCLLGCDTPYVMTPTSRYDPVSDAWLPGPQPAGRYMHKAVTLADGRVVLIGGGDRTVFRNTRSDVEIYFPSTGTWSSGARMEEARERFAAVLLPDGRILVAGGSNDDSTNILNSVEIISVRA